MLNLKHFKMYPKVKVRAYEQDDCPSPTNDSKAGPFFASPESPSIQEKENQSCSQLPITRILKAYVLDSTMQLSSASKVENKRSRLLKGDKPELKACSVPRPRAVLSSPNNDWMIGTRNKLIDERRFLLKHKTEEKATSSARTKLTPSQVKPEKKPLKNNMTKTSEKAFKSKSEQKPVIRKFQEHIVESQKVTTRSLRVGKSNLA